MLAIGQFSIDVFQRIVRIFDTVHPVFTIRTFEDQVAKWETARPMEIITAQLAISTYSVSMAFFTMVDSASSNLSSCIKQMILQCVAFFSLLEMPKTTTFKTNTCGSLREFRERTLLRRFQRPIPVLRLPMLLQLGVQRTKLLVDLLLFLTGHLKQQRRK